MNRYDAAPDAALGAELLSVIARLNRWTNRYADWALPTAQARLLAQIDELGAARIGDLARVDHCSQPGMTAQIRRLEASGLVRRSADPDDARAVLISLTPHGRRSLDDVRCARTTAITPVIGRLAGADRRRLRAALHTLTDLLDAASCESRCRATQEKP